MSKSLSRLRYFSESGLLTEAGEEPVGLDHFEQVAGVHVLPLFERTVESAYLGERERLGHDRDGLLGGG